MRVVCVTAASSMLLSAIVTALPVIPFAAIVAGCFVCYHIAVSYGHIPVTPRWPFVSDVGTNPPESCIFSLILFWAGLISIVVILTFYSYVRAKGAHSHWNNAGLVCGIIAFVGSTFVASFQWTEVLYPHMVGAFMTFGGLGVYSWMLSAITWHHLKNSTPKWLLFFRITIAVIITVITVPFLIFFIIRHSSPVHFQVATSLEWTVLFVEIFSIATLSYELRSVRCLNLAVVLNDCVAADLPNAAEDVPNAAICT